MAGALRLDTLKSAFGSLIPGGSSVGLCIGTSSIKCVEIAQSGKSFQLKKIQVELLQEDVILNREIIRADALLHSLKKIKQNKWGASSFSTHLGGPSLIIKPLQVDVKNTKEIEEAVFWEAEQYLPFDPSEVVMDYYQLSRDKSGKTDVVFVAAKLSVLESYQDLLQSAQIKVEAIDAEIFGLLNIFETNYPQYLNETIALVDLGASATRVLVTQGGKPLYVKDSAIGGKNLTSEIQKQLGLSFVDAEAIKKSPKSELPQEVSELMGVTMDHFATEIKRALDFYNASSNGKVAQSILITGGCALLPGIAQWIEDKLGLPTQSLNPFETISFNQKEIKPETLEGLAPLIAVPMGLALRKFIKGGNS